MSRFLRYSSTFAVGVVVAVLVGCSGMGETPASEESVPTAMHHADGDGCAGFD